ncbi:transcriptional regulator [Clostridium polyendosporum]|uniref:Transcriptional regulator n=1 Tax=Clostridium polyendosporum TaxID=69208 RepID=A0A919RWF8_9CLOT|nr:helix-turn-helix domain-containing protein [Clostridium polyendosporum]GIM27579.1 transcriptional regulator [Clostridium polyendosporum]
MITHKGKNYLCLLDFGMDFVRGKWKSLILCNLYNGSKRFLELQRLLCSVSQKVLTDNLKELEDAELITKIVYPEIPPRVEYSLTPMGIDFTKALRTIEEWSEKYYSHLKNTDIK